MQEVTDMAQFVLSDGFVDKIVEDYVREKHGFDEKVWKVAVEHNDEDRAEHLVRVYVTRRE